MNEMPSGPLSRATQEERARNAARIEAEFASLCSSADPFAAAVRITRMPMVITNPREADNPIVFANESFCKLTGYALEEILGRNCRFLQGPETDPATISRVRDAIAAVEPLEIDLRNYRKNQEPFWNRLLIAPVRDSEGELAYFFASQVDITFERERFAELQSHNAALTAEVDSRLRAQQAQQESEAQLRFATEAGRLGIWELNLRTDQLTVTAVFKENFGRRRDQGLTYEELRDVVHPDDRERMAAAIQHSVATGAGYDIEHRILRQDGQVGWVQTRAQVVHDTDGAALSMAGISLDVTERRQAELSLQYSEESLRLANEAAEIGTWNYDTVTGGLTWSDRKRAMFGISAGVPVSLETFHAGLHPDDRDAIEAAFAAAVDPAVRAPYEIEFRTLGAEDQASRWVAAKGRGVFEGGLCLRLLGTAIDVTARKLASNRQAFLLALLDRLRTLTEPRAIMKTAGQALGRHLGAGRVGYGHSDGDEEAIELEDGYLDGVKPINGTFPLVSFGAHYAARLRQGSTNVVNDVLADPDAPHATWAAIEARAFVAVPLLRNGRLRAALYVNQRTARCWSAEDVALIEDVAGRSWETVERARAEAALRETNERLEARVAERTRELMEANNRLRAEAKNRAKVEDALRQSQKMEAVGQLTGGIAHDFNNMLQGVGSSLELMRRRIMQGRATEADRLGEVAAEGVRRAATLTNRLLAFARRQALQPHAVDPDKLIEGMAELVRRTVGSAITVELHPGDSTWPVLCDANQLESALLNVAINARDAMPGGGVIGITTTGVRLLAADLAGHAGIMPGDYVEIAMADTGAGMTPDVMARAFEPFFTTKPIGQGTGLGLSQLYGFVHQSGGFVRLSSAPSQGTTVRLYLPRHSAGEAAPVTVSVRQAAVAADAGGTLLVVEDEQAVRSLVSESLRDLGYRVLEAEDGPAGLRVLLAPGHLDMLVTDVGLPGLNGRQLADAAQQARPGLPVLLITGYAGSALESWQLAPGMEVLGKPFALDALSTRIGTILERRTGTAGARAKRDRTRG